MKSFAVVLRRPVTLTIVVLYVAVFVVWRASGPANGPLAQRHAGVDLSALAAGHWWALVTAMFATTSIVQLVTVAVLAAIGVGWAEGRMGSWRTAVAFFSTGVVSTGLGLGIEALGVVVDEYWSSSVVGVATFDPVTPLYGTVAWATAWASPGWRRRIRVAQFATGAALLLYSGQPSDLFLLVAALLGVVLGNWQHGSVRRARSAADSNQLLGRLSWRASRHETRSLLAIVTIVFALGPVLTVVSNSRFGLLSPLGLALTNDPNFTAHHACDLARLSNACVAELVRVRLHGIGGGIVSVMPVVAMLICARGIFTGRRLALWVLVVLSVLQAIAAGWYFGVLRLLGQPFALPVRDQSDWEFAIWLIVNSLVPLGFAAILVANRRFLPIATGRTAVAFLLSSTFGALVFTGAVYVAVGSALGGGFVGARGPLDFLADFPERLTPAAFLRRQVPLLTPHSPAAHLLYNLVGPTFWILVILALIAALRIRPAEQLDQAGREGLRAVLRTGTGSLGWMASWPGNRVWFSADGKAGVAYQVSNGCAVTIGEPFGRPTEFGSLVVDFAEFCDSHALNPVFYSVHEPWCEVLDERGWASIVVAEEISIDPREFHLDGGAMKEVRTSVNKAARTGVHARWGSWHELPLRFTAQVTALSEDWMAEKQLPEMGFTLGGIDQLADPEVLVGLALDQHERVLGVTSWLPVWRDGVVVGRTLDFMRREPTAPNGVMEFLIADAFARFGVEGLETASLSASPLADSGARDAEPVALDRVLGMVGGMLEPVYGFRSLLRFKRKFSRSLEPLHMCYRDSAQLPAIGLAIARLYLPTLTIRQGVKVVTGR